MNSHELIQDLKRVASDLGKVPTREEYVKHGNYTKRDLYAAFGTFQIFLTAAGLKEPKPKRVDASIFNVNIESHIQKYEPTRSLERKPYPRISVISDIHWPFSNQRVVEKFFRRVESTRPEWVILNGDAWDFYSHAKFPRSHNAFTPREEESLARKMNEEFWIEVKKASPNSKCVQMLGNHDIRPITESAFVLFIKLLVNHSSPQLP